MASPKVKEQIKLPAKGASGTITSVDVNMWVAAKAGVVFDIGDLARANLAAGVVPSGVNTSANDRPLDVNAYLTAHGLWPTLDGLRTLLASAFGATSSVAPRLETDRETGMPDLIFEIRTSPRRSYEDQRNFLDQYLAQVPRPAGALSPTLLWDPPVRAAV